MRRTMIGGQIERTTRLLFAGDYTPAWMPQIGLAGKAEVLGKLLGDSRLRSALLGRLRASPPRRWKPLLAEMATALYPLGAVEGEFRRARLSCVNLECLLSRQGEKLPGKQYHLRAPPEHVGALVRNRVRIAGLANNHILDYGPVALQETLDLLAAQGILVSGLREDEERQKAVLASIGTSTVGILSYVDPSIIDPSPEVFFRECPHPYPLGAEAIVEDIRLNRPKVDLLAVQLHWGTEWSHRVREDQRALARRLVEEGANIIVGHHPHVVQDYEEYRGGLIFYSLGNLFMSLPDVMGVRARFGFLAAVEIADGCIASYEVISLDNQSERPRRGEDVTFDRWLDGPLDRPGKDRREAVRLSERLGDCRILRTDAAGVRPMPPVGPGSLLRIPLEEVYTEGPSGLLAQSPFAPRKYAIEQIHADGPSGLVAASREFYGHDLRNCVLCHSPRAEKITIDWPVEAPGLLAAFACAPNWSTALGPIPQATLQIRAAETVLLSCTLSDKDHRLPARPLAAPANLSVEIHNPTGQELAVGFDVAVFQ